MSTGGSAFNQNGTEKIDLLLSQLREEISNITGKGNLHASRVDSLENDLNAYKSLCNDLRAEQKKYQQLLQNLEKEKDDLESSIKGHRIVALLDGDGMIFTTELILAGRFGGQEAARVLSKDIIQFLKANYGAKPYQLWVKIFLNKHGLIEAYKRFGNVNDAIEDKFEEFMLGFNQAAERFSIVDVGAIKEAADAKIKAHLEDDLRIPQTEKVVFGGCHDTGYINSLRSHITSGFREKLILLPGYADMAFGIAELQLPTLPTLPYLFISQKLGSPPVHPPGIPIPGMSRKNRGNSVPRANMNTFASANISPPLSQMGTPRSNLMTLESIGQVNQSKIPDGQNDVGQMMTLDPKVPLAKQNPPPCTHYYVSGRCRYGTRCSYGHNYVLNELQLAEIQRKAKNTPCDSLNKNIPCPRGDGCFYGHFCPAGAKCNFLKRNTCRFGGAVGHQMLEVQPDSVEASAA